MKFYQHILTITIASFATIQVVKAQDLHFSQFMNSPLTTNPANTGFMPEGDYRLGVHYRNQYSSVMAIPYRTMSAFGDAQIMMNKESTGWLGVGGVILHDVAGSGNLTSTKVYGSVAYHQMINAGSLVSVGFNAGWANKRINVSNLKFPDQFDGKFFDNKLPTSVLLDNTNINYLDVQAGLNYAYFPNDNVYVNAGFSVHHINTPRESFFNAQPGVDNRIPRRYIGFLNGSFKLNDQWIINPNIYYTNMARSAELNGGMNARYNLSGDGEYQLIGGLYYRHKDAIIPMLGVGYKDITATFTYDVTVSGLRNFNGSRGAYEFTLIKQGVVDKYNGNRKQAMCPTFKNY